MKIDDNHTRRRSVRFAFAAVVIALVAAACSSSSDESAAPASQGGSGGEAIQYDQDYAGGADAGSPSDDGAFKTVVTDSGSIVFVPTGNTSIDAKVIRDGSVELRIDPGSFGATTAQIRTIAADLGGYVASGESRIEEYDDERYAVGWFTIRIPTDRFDDAVARIGDLGENVSSTLSSQDVTEEYVDLEGRLNYWREQEAFYTRLMEEATTIDDLVTIQTRMQEVLLNIEEIEGRLRYLDSRTQFATLTVGLTEVPDGPIVPVEPVDAGPIAQAFAQAGEVLLATVAFLIVGAAVLIPIGVLALFVYMLTRLFLSLRRKEESVEG
ncbi:hypothetical protein MNBD_ACTINO01-451 [hydrothermal vent metagenome]|uniref:DUF4349 domain-containing protein n=1 Tax=hydrothermal vent metagenome TaxID=652676 RepID=A0A3B0S1T4_9ZZZZ